MKKKSVTTIGFILIIVIVLLVGVYLNFTFNSGTTTVVTNTTQTSSTTTTSSNIKGVVTGYVTVGPAQPVCTVSQTCNVNMSGYSLVFTPQCIGSSSNCQAYSADLSPSGHYSIFLPAGNYSVTGLRPSCSWIGCTSTFPKTVVVEGGMQLVFNVDIDTGLR